MRNVFILILYFVFFGYSPTKAQSENAVFTSFRNMENANLKNSNFKVWKSETLILPIRLNSKPGLPLSFKLNTSNLLFSSSVYKLHYVEGDKSAGYCGTDKSGGIFEKGQFPDRAEKLNSNTFTPDSANHYILLELRIDQKTKAGKYPFEIVVSQGESSFSAKATIQVLNQKLPNISTVNYKVDFWQFPLSVSDYYQIKPWSEEHLSYLADMFDQLKGINQDAITASIFWDLYNSTVKSSDELMIQMVKKRDGTFSYDYSNFEKYVNLGIQRGVAKQISVHNLFPWNNTFFYCDEGSQQVVSFQSAPGTDLYEQFWTPFLIDFANYLKKKNWFDRVVMVIDERNFPETIALAKFVQKVAPGLKMGYAGAFNSELSTLMYDYSVPSNVILESADLAKRKSLGFKTTIYTSCWERQPNLVIGSNLDDAYYLTMVSKTRGYDGMLRWAFNKWSPQILTSAIYSDVPSGDAHFVYPGNQYSLRYLILKDALEDVLKFDVKQKGQRKTSLADAQNRYFLLNTEAERMKMIDAMKSYLND